MEANGAVSGRAESLSAGGMVRGMGRQAGGSVEVRDAAGFQRAVAAATPGTRIRVAPGEYPGGFFFGNVHGQAGKPIVIEAADPKNRPVFRGRSNGIQFSSISHVELRNLVFLGATGNGLNIDDGGKFGTSRHVTLTGLRVGEMNVRGNHDGIKLSGLTDFRIQDCVVDRWGVGGQGIDMVGCHRGVIEGCTIRHTDEEASTGVQMKGGTRDIAVRRCQFDHAGGRALNIGGSTGLQFFRPPLDRSPGPPRNYEAKAIQVEGCTFIGSGAPFAFVGVDGATVRFNSVYLPRRWAIRILQETREPDFVPSRNGVFTDNIIVFGSDRWGEGGVNIGPNTAPETFRFARNVWYCQDAPARSRPRLPAPETDGKYGVDPQFRAPERGDFTVPAGSPAAKAGAAAWKG
jgi:hypothetical protein